MALPFSFFRTNEEKRLLSKEEEYALGIRIEAGRVWKLVPGKKKPQPILNEDAVAAAQVLVAHNPRLVMRAVLRMDHSKRMCEDDLLQHGLAGLTEAATRWNYRRGRFSTYSMFWVKKAILNCMVTESRVVKIPSNARAEIRASAKSTRFKGFGKGYSKTMARALNALRMGLFQEQSLSREYNPSDKGANDPAKIMERDDRREQAFRAMQVLGQRERDILTLRFINHMTIKDIARRMRTSKKLVRKISIEAIGRVRAFVRREEEE